MTEPISSVDERPRRLPDVLRERARTTPHRVAHDDTTRALTFADWDAEADAIGGGLAASGVSEGDRVLLPISNAHATAFASAFLGVQWALRSERWRNGHVGYANACSADIAFLATSTEGGPSDADEPVRAGYYVADGRRLAIVDGVRTVDRDPDEGFIRRLKIDAEDSAGRRFTASGNSISRMAMPIPGVAGVVWTSLVEWEVEGHPAWGEDQDAWSIDRWSEFRRHGFRPQRKETAT